MTSEDRLGQALRRTLLEAAADVGAPPELAGRAAARGRARRRRTVVFSALTAVVVVVGGVTALGATAGGDPDRLLPTPTPTPTLTPTPTPTASAPTFSPSPVPASVSREVACPTLAPVHLPADQDTVTDAFVCGQELRAVAGDGEWSFLQVRRVTGGLDALLAAYSSPDDTRPLPPNVGCTMDLPDPRVVYLHSAQGVRAVRAPHNQCSDPTADGVAAYDALRLTLVWERRDRQTQTQQSVDTGCSDRYKDMLWEDARYAGNEPSRQLRPSPLAQPVKVCRYRDVVDAQGDRVGHLTGSGTLSAQQLDAVNKALARATVDAGCSRQAQSEFALLLGPSPEDITTVALDGCAVSQNNGGWWRAGDDLRAALR